MNFQELKNKIIAWFWKMGYKLGNAVGLLGKGIVDDAFSSGFRDTAFESINMETLLDNLESAYDDEFASMADFTSVSAASDLGTLEFKDVFVELFEGYFPSAHSVFTNNGWSVDWLSYDSINDVWNSDTQQNGTSGSRVRYTKDAEEIVVEVTRNPDSTIASATVIVGK